MRRACVASLLVLSACASGRTPKLESPSGWPVARDEVTVSSPFGASRGGSFHQGIDLSVPEGTRARATAAGHVRFAGRSGAYGRMVIIDHGEGWESCYAHLARFAVKAGQRVRRGEVVGTVGKSGNASGIHLHYEVRHHGVAIDPWPSMTGGR
jgi:murein DD-endopeptidase MepM/ murein hydrolase activator NlpD